MYTQCTKAARNRLPHSQCTFVHRHTYLCTQYSHKMYRAVSMMRLCCSVLCFLLMMAICALSFHVCVCMFICCHFYTKQKIHNAIGSNNNHKNPNLNHQVVVLVSAHRQMLGIYVPVYVSDDGGSYWTDEPCLSMCDWKCFGVHMYSFHIRSYVRSVRIFVHMKSHQ